MEINDGRRPPKYLSVDFLVFEAVRIPVIDGHNIREGLFGICRHPPVGLGDVLPARLHGVLPDVLMLDPLGYRLGHKRPDVFCRSHGAAALNGLLM